MAIDNCQYFIKDCASCKYSIASLDCQNIISSVEGCIACPNCDKSSRSVYGMCNCVKDADQTLEHCPYYEEDEDD